MVRRIFALALSLIVLSGVLGAGQTYLWCSMMQASVETCCCAPDGLHEGKTPEIFNGCCEGRDQAALDQARLVSSAIEVPPALPAAEGLPSPVLVAAVPPRAWVPASLPAAVRASPIRAGPRAASELCARLQVFRC